MSFFARHMMSYLAIIFVSASITITYFVQSIYLLEKNNEEYYGAFTEYIQKEYDLKIQSLLNIVYMFSGNEDTLNFINGTSRSIMSERDISLSLAERMLPYNYVEDIIVYSAPLNILISSSGIYSPSEYYSYKTDYFENSVMAQDAWLEIFNSHHSQEAIMTGKTVLFSQSIPLKTTSGTSFIGFILKADDIFSAINSKNISAGLFLIDSGDRFLGGPDEAPSFSFQSLLGMSGTVKEKDTVYVNLKSRASQFFYNFSIPKSQFNSSSTYFVYIIIIAITIMLIIGISIAYYYSKRTRQKLKNLLTLASTEELDEVDFETLEKSIKTMQSENFTLRTHKERFFSDDIRRLLTMNPIYTNASGGDFLKDKSCFGVVTFFPEQYENLFEDGNISDNFDNLIFIVQNVFCELSSRYGDGHIIDLSGMIVVLMCFNSSDSESAFQNLMACATNTKEFIEHSFNTLFTVAVSDIVFSAEDIYTAYESTRNTLEYKNLVGAGQVMPCREYISKADSANSTIALESALVQHLKLENYQEVADIIRRMRGMLQSSTPSMIKLKTSFCANEILNHLSRNGQQEYIHPFLNSDSGPPSFIELERIVSSISVESVDKDLSLVNEVKNFVNNNCTSPNISVSTIADNFNVNISYLSKVFKAVEKTGLLKYIHAVRIERSKLLLADPSISIKSIAEQSGYLQSITYINTFKKLEGITPGAYREKMLSH